MGYNFEKKYSVFYPTIRPWFKSSTEGDGLTTFVSSYMFVDNYIGNTIAQNIYINSKIVGVIAYDILPFSNTINKNTIMYSLMDDILLNDNVKYLVVEGNLLLENHWNQLADDLIQKLYIEDNETKEDNSYQEKYLEILSTLHYTNFEISNQETIKAISYYYKNKRKYMSFSEIELLRIRLDGSTKREIADRIAFVIDSEAFDEEIDKQKSAILKKILITNIIVIFVCTLLTTLVSIISSRLIADFFMNRFLDLCVRMRIAQVSRKKLQALKSRNKQVEFSERFEQYRSPRGFKEFEALCRQVDDALIVYKLRQFKLTEQNSREYNSKALCQFNYVANMFEDQIEILKDSGSDTDSKELDEIYSRLFKCYNSIG